MFSRWKRGMLKENQITEEFIEDLEKCNKILKTKKSDVKIATDSSSKFINFDNLYNRFNPSQLFYKKFPISVRNFKAKSLENYKYGNECSICLDELNNGKNLTQIIHCKHVFHKNCIESWFDKKIFNVDGTEIDDDDNPIRKRTCPHCQQRINVDPKNKNQAEKCEIKN
uniref:RING-type domain-containing protein n=1 Tax=Meloidogyne enterolobii TaxID=390850 RepID=A0A6V7V4Q2_MELEN|nr:unnamed protein product [Meloidogyne enterolobii]